MEKIIVTIVKEGRCFAAWIDDIPGIYGVGDTIEETKTDLENAIDIYINNNTQVPVILLEEYELVYKEE